MPIFQPPSTDGQRKRAAVQRIADDLENVQAAVTFGRLSVIEARPRVIGKLMTIQMLTGNTQVRLVDSLSVWAMQEWAISVRKKDGLEEDWRLLLGELKEHSDLP